ncbi:MAG: hypothetical protein RLZZ271_1196, partial [Pseudomonadota bacterium]
VFELIELFRSEDFGHMRHFICRELYYAT